MKKVSERAFARPIGLGGTMKDFMVGEGSAAASTSQSRRTIAVHRDWTKLETEWRQLEEKGFCTVFQTYDWVSTWYKCTSRHGVAEPLVVTVSDAGGLAWILPLCRHRWKGLDVISLAGLGVSDYGGLVMAPDDRIDPQEVPEVLADILNVLPPSDMVHFQKLQNQIQDRPNPLRQMKHLVAMRESCYGIHVNRPWAEMAPDLMQSRLRSTIRQQKRKIAALGPLSLKHYDDPKSISSAMTALWAMRQRRFDDIGRDKTPQVWHDFYFGVAEAPKRRLEVSVTILKVGETPIAASFGLSRDKAYLSVMPTFAIEEWGRFRPGMLMFDAMLAEFGPKTDFQGYFDFTIGDEPYKQRFGATGSPLFESMTPRSLKGALAHLYWRFKVSRRFK